MTRNGVLFLIGIYILYLETRIFVEAVIGTALYCRDPDTGKLHAPNTTWPSTTFCGNYACRLKKRNESTIEYTPNTSTTKSKESTQTTKTKEETKNEKQNPQSTRKDNLNVIPEPYKKQELKETLEPKGETTVSKPTQQPHENNPNVKLRFQISKLEDALGDNDRYLSEDEIKIISDLLYTVKKSDLEAIVDIYNLAQEIYNEMERPPTEEILNLQKKKPSSNHLNPYFQLQTAVNKNSYWYEPLQSDPVKSDTQDMALQASNLLLSSPTAMPTTTPEAIQPQLLDDFRKLPYNNPSSKFQTSIIQVKPEKNVIPPINQFVKKTTIRPMLAQRVYSPLWAIPKPPEKAVVPPNNLRPEAPILLPYPFSHVRYNITAAQMPVHYGMNPYNLGLNKNNQNPGQVNVPKMSFINPINFRPDGYNHRNSLEKFLTVAQWPVNAVADKVFLVDKKYSSNKIYTSEHRYVPENEYAAEYKYSLDSKVAQEKNEPKADKTAWLTNPLPERVIEAIQAKIENGVRPVKSYFPHKRMVKLESYGRGMKQAETRNRSKREQSFDEYEAVIEKKTCVSDESPGFFRKGNESEPFPSCCPQRIQYKLQEQTETRIPFQ